MASPVRGSLESPALRAAQAPSHVGDAHSSLPGELSLPSIHHGELDGFVLLGNKPKGETYRPDEIEVLGHTAHQVGLDLRALRLEQLERDVAELSARNDALALALQRGTAPSSIMNGA